MTAHRDPDRLIDLFLAEGQTRLADPVFDAVRATIEETNQRAVVGPWRTPLMHRLVPVGLGAAAVLVILAVGTQLLGSQPREGSVGAPSVAPSASGEPSATPSPSVASPSDGAGLPEGPYSLTRGTGVPMMVTIPGPGWTGDPSGGVLVKADADPPDGAGIIVFDLGNEWHVPADACALASTTPAAAATTVDEIVDALTAQASRNASAPVDITMGGYAGKAIQLHVPDDAVLEDCEEGKFCTLGTVESYPADSCQRFAQGPGQIDELWIADVEGRTVIVDWMYYAGTAPADVAQLQTIVESITLE